MDRISISLYGESSVRTRGTEIDNSLSTERIENTGCQKQREQKQRIHYRLKGFRL